MDHGVEISHHHQLIREAQDKDRTEIVLLVIDENHVQIDQKRHIKCRIGAHRGKTCDTAVALISGQPIAY